MFIKLQNETVINTEHFVKMEVEGKRVSLFLTMPHKIEINCETREMATDFFDKLWKTIKPL